MFTGNREDLSKAYKEVFSTDQGKIVLSDLYTWCGMDRPVRVPGNVDETLHNASLQHIGRHLQAMLNQSVDELLTSTKHNKLLVKTHREVYGEN